MTFRPLSDTEKQDVLLRWFYDNRHNLQGSRGISIPYTDSHFLESGQWGKAEIYRIALLLYRSGMVSAGFLRGGDEVYPHELLPAGVRAIEQPRPPMSESNKLRALLQAVTDGQDVNAVAGFSSPFERADMVQAAQDAGLLNAAISEDGAVVYAKLLPSGRAVLSGDRPGPFDPQPPPVSQINNTFHGPINAPIQIGNQNTQNIDNRLQAIVEAIEEADVPEEEKAQARSALFGFVSHPAVGNTISGAGLLAQILAQTMPGG